MTDRPPPKPLLNRNDRFIFGAVFFLVGGHPIPLRHPQRRRTDQPVRPDGRPLNARRSEWKEVGRQAQFGLRHGAILPIRAPIPIAI
jgi:hypothetical protein